MQGLLAHTTVPPKSAPAPDPAAAGRPPPHLQVLDARLHLQRVRGLLAVAVALDDVTLGRLAVAHGRGDALEAAEALKGAVAAVPDHHLAVEDGVVRDDLRGEWIML